MRIIVECSTDAEAQEIWNQIQNLPAIVREIFVDKHRPIECVHVNVVKNVGSVLPFDRKE